MFTVKDHFFKLKESATLAINEKVKAIRREGKTVYHFGFGQSPFPVHRSIQDELIKQSHRKEYLPTKGLLELRQAISQYLKRELQQEFHEESIFIAPGSKELIYQTMLLFNGEILIPAPSWVSYGPQSHMCGKEAHIIETQKELGYQLDANTLDEYCQKNDIKNALLILNAPGNPSGLVFTDEQYREIAQVCRRYNIVILSDEIYSEITFDNISRGNLQQHYPEATIVSGGLSKIFSAGGYRLGYLAIPKEFKELNKALCASISETYSCVSAPIQAAAIKAYDASTELREELKLCNKIHQASGQYLYSRFKELKINGPRPHGAFYLLADFSEHAKLLQKRGINGSEQLAQALLDELSIAMLPGTDFYLSDDAYCLRVSTVDYDGAEILKAAKQHKEIGHDFIEKQVPHFKEACDLIKKWLQE